MQLVKDWEVAAFRSNVLGLAKTAQLFNLPTILTTSREDGPNGPLLSELKEMFPKAPYIARPGEINAWDNPEFKKAVEVRPDYSPGCGGHDLALLGLALSGTKQYIVLLSGGGCLALTSASW